MAQGFALAAALRLTALELQAAASAPLEVEMLAVVWVGAGVGAVVGEAGGGVEVATEGRSTGVD